MNAVHRRTPILQGEINVEAITPWGALTADQQAQCRKLALDAITAERSKDDASAASILDTWLTAERRINAVVSGKNVAPTIYMLVPITPFAPEPDLLDLERWLAVEGHHFQFAIGARLLLRSNPEAEATRRQRLLADRALDAARTAQAEERAFHAEQRREAELESRKQQWAQIDPVVRALLRGHTDPATAAIFDALAAAYLKEPRRVDEQPPRCAWAHLGIKASPKDKE